jgi:hypothetical protein
VGAQRASGQATARGPDFLGVGFTRTATSWLHEQLRSHPGIWLPPMKEIYYWSFQRGRGIWNRRQREHARALLPAIGRALAGAPDGWRDLAWGARYLGAPPSDRWWRSLYPALPGRRVGQIEPTYATLPKETITALAGVAPDVRLFFLMRDPIDRAWSTVTKQLARFHDRPLETFSDERVIDKIERQGIPMSSYLDHIERWESVFPSERFAFGFYEEVLADPAGLVDRMSVHVGAGPHPSLDADALRRRVNDTLAFRSPIPARFERRLAEGLVEPTRRLAERFAGPAVGWLERAHAVLEGRGEDPA